MNRELAKQIADKITNEQLVDMFSKAREGITDWRKRSTVNKSFTKGTAWNLLAANFNPQGRYTDLAKTNMVWEFGDYLPSELIPKKIRRKYPVPVHQEPKFDKWNTNLPAQETS